MKKKMITGLLQYIGAIVLVLCSVFTVYAFDAGKLPFMDEDYLEARSQAEVGVPLPDTEVEDTESEQPQQTVTAATFINSLPKADKTTVPNSGFYKAEDFVLANRSMAELGVIGEAQLSVRCGFLVKTVNGEVVSVYDSSLNDVTSIVNGWSLTYLREGGGRPLFTKDGQHAYVENGKLVPCEYDSVNLDKGVYAEYPAYLADYDRDYTAFKEGGLYGLKRTDGTVVVPAKYADVYGMTEGYCIAVDGNKRLYLYDKNGTLISDKYFAAEKDDSSAVGYYFVRNGITRARDAAGKEVMLRTDGTVISVPSGFEVCAYSDGAILLKGETGYGYMNYKGRWIGTPDYKQATTFNEGLAVVCDGNGNYGMIACDGTTVVPFAFSNIVGCSDGVILAYAQEYGYYIINKLTA